MRYIKNTLSKYAKSNVLRLHMPGHKGKANSFDNTEIPSTDDFNSPKGPYKRAQDLLSEVYLSSGGFYLTTGATTGIQAMALYAKITGHQLILPRNSHMSAINACCMYNTDFIIVEPEYDDHTNTYLSIEEKIIEFIGSYNGKGAVFITSPDYYGRCADIGAIRKAIDDKDILIFCDEAHGSHFHFSKLLPDNASAYADIWVDGAHKTLGALTQGALLFCSSSINKQTLQSILSGINTSSPSHLIALTIEEAIADAQKGKWDRRAKDCRRLENKINNLRYIKCIDAVTAREVGFADKDVCRVVLDCRLAGGGFKVYKDLFEKYKIQLEMADFRYAVAIMTTYDKFNCDKRFFNAIKKLDVQSEMQKVPIIPKRGEMKVPISEAWMKNISYKKPDNCEGAISAVAIGAYPPGLVLILPGEKITREHIEYLKKVISQGGSVFGAANGDIAVCEM